jgi:hypothetical protein
MFRLQQNPFSPHALVPNLSHMNPINILRSYYFKTIFRCLARPKNTSKSEALCNISYADFYVKLWASTSNPQAGEPSLVGRLRLLIQYCSVYSRSYAMTAR